MRPRSLTTSTFPAPRRRRRGDAEHLFSARPRRHAASRHRNERDEGHPHRRRPLRRRRLDAVLRRALQVPARRGPAVHRGSVRRGDGHGRGDRGIVRGQRSANRDHRGPGDRRHTARRRGAAVHLDPGHRRPFRAGPAEARRVLRVQGIRRRRRSRRLPVLHAVQTQQPIGAYALAVAERRHRRGEHRSRRARPRSRGADRALGWGRPPGGLGCEPEDRWDGGADERERRQGGVGPTCTGRRCRRLLHVRREYERPNGSRAGRQRALPGLHRRLHGRHGAAFIEVSFTAGSEDESIVDRKLRIPNWPSDDALLLMALR